MALMFAICNPQPNCMPRKPKLMFQICQKVRGGLSINSLAELSAGNFSCRCTSPWATLLPIVQRETNRISEVPRLHHLAVFVELEMQFVQQYGGFRMFFCLNCLSCLSQNGRIGGERWAVPSVCRAHSDADRDQESLKTQPRMHITISMAGGEPGNAPNAKLMTKIQPGHRSDSVHSDFPIRLPGHSQPRHCTIARGRCCYFRL